MNRIYKCFPGGKFKVLTLSYDDGKLEDKSLVDIFNKNGIRATFNVNSGLTDMPSRLSYMRMPLFFCPLFHIL